MEPQNENLAVSPADPMPVSSVDYAPFSYRFGAALIDGVLLAVVNSAVNIFRLTSSTGMYGNPGESAFNALGGSMFGVLIGYVYFVVMTTTTGATLGKKLMKLRVQNIDTGENLDYMGAILREVVGKFLSSAALMLGYLWMIWDPQKQAWHDKLAKSVVVKVK